uniref:Uncharacterized protein n=1 Tax=Strigamia maritima TaxID=126957 RepID=T1J578_STRMM
MKFPIFIFLIFSLDLITCETPTSVLPLTSDQTTIESQLAQTETTTAVTITSKPEKNSKTRKPSCRIVYKNVKAPSHYPTWNKDKLTMACTVCNFKGYKESCVYTDKKIVKNIKENSETSTQLAQESRQSVTITSSTEPMLEKSSKHYIPTFETTASSTIDEKQDEDESNEDENPENSGEETKDKKDESYFSYPTNFVPKEYLDPEYDAKFYEEHDAAANIYHKTPYGVAASNEEDDESSEEKGSTKESRHSYRQKSLPGFDEVRKVLPDVDPLNVDTLKPRKRQKTIEYNEETSFSSDDDESDNAKKSSKMMPRWRGMDSQGESTAPRSRGEHPAQRGGGYTGSYKPPFDMPAFDTKNCKVTYKESPSGGPKMKCMNCKDQSNAYSEECGVEYEEPTKHREVFYNNGKYSPMKEHSSNTGYGSHNAPVQYYYPHYGYSGGKMNSESRIKYPTLLFFSKHF